jgi:uroporphyrinogen decarboxylase
MPTDNLDSRYPDKWDEQVRAAAASDDLVMVNAGWYYYTLTQILGTVNASLFMYDAYDLVDEYFERINTVALDGIRRAAKLTKIDVICFGEDIAYKNGPFISPDMNRALLVPRYKKIMDLANSVGCDMAFFGSDGDFRSLIDDYLGAGVNIIEPCEVAAGMVPVELRRRFGRELRIIGGIDKREIAKGPKHIDAEIKRNRPVIEEGGYLPYVDHTFSADISFVNFCYYMEALKKALGIP